jgi:hypothetical protein
MLLGDRETWTCGARAAIIREIQSIRRAPQLLYVLLGACNFFFGQHEF